jgi:exodeoxyribonuclease VII small subunit
MPPKKKAVDFEQSLQSLEDLVNRMEQGDIEFGRVAQCLSKRNPPSQRECQTRLAEAEQQVNLLIEENDQYRLEAFDSRTGRRINARENFADFAQNCRQHVDQYLDVSFPENLDPTQLRSAVALQPV